jgi:hypothetical protein
VSVRSKIAAVDRRSAFVGSTLGTEVKANMMLLPKGSVGRPMSFGIPSAFVKLFGRLHDDPSRSRQRQAYEKHQWTKSRLCGAPHNRDYAERTIMQSPRRRDGRLTFLSTG